VKQPGGHDGQEAVTATDIALTRLVDVETLRRLQDRFAALGQVSVCICTVDGDPLTPFTWGTRFSSMVGTSPRGREALVASLRALALDPGSKVPSLCHEGLTLYTAPIVYKGQRLALIVVGTRPALPPTFEEVRAVAHKYELDPGALAATIDRTAPHTGATPEATHRFADVLAGTIATLYGQAARIQRQLADLTTVHDLAELLSGTRDLEEILDRTVQRVVEVMPVKACGIRLLNEETGELVIKAVCNLSDEYLRKGAVMLRESKIDSAAFAGETVYIEDAPSDPRTRYPENARREGIVSGLCVPMMHRGQTVGVMRVYTSRRYEFSESEASLIRSIGSQAAAAIINSRLFEERAAAERFQRQVKAAGEIQRRMLPSEPPRPGRVRFGCVYVPTLEVGGDFYDFISLPDGEVGVCIADVVGKGLPAALLMASVRSALRTSARCECAARLAVAEVNRHMCGDTLTSEFATLVYGVFSKDGSRFTYCNAGHPPPLLLRGGELTELRSGGTVIGITSEAEFEHETIEVRPGDVIVMVTDGVTEAMDFHSVPYGRKRLEASIHKHSSLDVEQLAKQILWDVRRFVGLAEQSDDITIVAVKAE
jgi:sigma-B regulation protein RsbU (phosphoserine phosphatase)